MKYNELERYLLRAGCREMGIEQNSHPLWFSPKTGKTFQMSHHKSHEVAKGTLSKILKTAGLL